jgi:NTP pyrophosphatase (non-canonical NTP hydrolase)
MLQEQIQEEVERAVLTYPTWPTDPLHALAVLGEEFGELTKAVLQHVYPPHTSSVADIRAEAIQTAAMALRFLASIESYRYTPSPQHEQDMSEEA